MVLMVLIEDPFRKWLNLISVLKNTYWFIHNSCIANLAKVQLVAERLYSLSSQTHLCRLIAESDQLNRRGIFIRNIAKYKCDNKKYFLPLLPLCPNCIQKYKFAHKQGGFSSLCKSSTSNNMIIVILSPSLKTVYFQMNYPTKVISQIFYQYER